MQVHFYSPHTPFSIPTLHYTPQSSSCDLRISYINDYTLQVLGDYAPSVDIFKAKYGKTPTSLYSLHFPYNKIYRKAFSLIGSMLNTKIKWRKTNTVYCMTDVLRDRGCFIRPGAT
jgi:hypothetical protein